MFSSKTHLTLCLYGNFFLLCAQPERDDETSRIEAAGGKIIYYDGYRVGGLLALSRAIGSSLGLKILFFTFLFWGFLLDAYIAVIRCRRSLFETLCHL